MSEKLQKTIVQNANRSSDIDGDNVISGLLCKALNYPFESFVDTVARV